MNTPENKTTVEGPNILGFILIGASALLSLVILVLWIRWLYNSGAPKCK
ncbi:hypothetical protein [Aureispira anguillae]|uniref:Uncharacterized protein n=1 Tax=Aureispira anguillae TaxID=2864201 RepID=A0A915YG01_9BACT|nr:hypothetical protein [Aureispira anguillae]BDS10569.1 hypothetical protein AsAng_0012770 [Aureispira anguillae]BDS10874.1 hypothetical protein AsAng_0015840 [Aureispira anguillae]BDS10928.1 hypothetical protein AsAng_0016380 [Aureispira anguillae]BDS12352.1 hypothetical protein AsAng_0030730 [Aureispira anguillae]